MSLSARKRAKSPSPSASASASPLHHSARLSSQSLSMRSSRQRIQSDGPQHSVASDSDSNTTADAHAPLLPGAVAASFSSSSSWFPFSLSSSVRSDLPAIILLVLLYSLQGVPLGLCFGSIPFLLQQAGRSYSDLGVFSLVSWPYSLKLLWSPLVDYYYLPRFGRRKSWIIPIQFLISLSLIGISPYIHYFITEGSISMFSFLFFVLIFLVATQDIAVDGLSLTILSQENISYASTCQSIGLNVGYFLSYTIFLALEHTGAVSLPEYIFYTGIAFLLVTIYVALFFTEKPEKASADQEDEDVFAIYGRLWRILKLKPVRQLVFVLLTARLGFIAVDSLTSLKITEKGVPKETLAGFAFILFPFELIFPIFIGRWVQKQSNPIVPWAFNYPIRLLMIPITLAIIYFFPQPPLEMNFYLLLLALSILNSLISNVSFVSICAFFSLISDSSIGGSYLTFLNTIANLGGTMPKFLVFQMVDILTCKPPSEAAASPTDKPLPSGVTKVLNDKFCSAVGSPLDGYYLVTIMGLIFGVVWFAFMRRSVLRLGTVPKEQFTSL